MKKTFYFAIAIIAAIVMIAASVDSVYKNNKKLTIENTQLQGAVASVVDANKDLNNTIVQKDQIVKNNQKATSAVSKYTVAAANKANASIGKIKEQAAAVPKSTAEQEALDVSVIVFKQVNHIEEEVVKS